MRQAFLVGISALLAAILLPGWLLPPVRETAQAPLVLVIDQPAQKQEEETIAIGCGGQILELPLETYLIGVVLSEMPASFELEALKAQTVAARTFALRQLSSGKHTDCDLCADSSCCQAWNSREEMEKKLGDSLCAYWNKVEQAVRDTEGEVLTYESQLIDAVYFSCSGGRTEDAVAVWGSDVPYLQSVSSDGEQTARVYETKNEVSAESFRKTLLAAYPLLNLSGDPDTWFGELTRTEGGGVDQMFIGGQAIKGTQLRQLFHLNSTNFTVSAGEQSVVFYVKGYGHRVGMSQYGANAMAKEGKNYREILTHYYTGAKVEHME